MTGSTILYIMAALVAALVIVVAVMAVQIHRLKFAAYHDPITGHYNWTWFWPHIGHDIMDPSLPYNFVHFDIKNFKMINELYDHELGNRVLSFVVSVIKKQDFVKSSARCDNDNFALVTDPLPEDEMRQKLMDMFEEMKYMPEIPEYPLYYRCGVVEKNKKIRAKDTVADLAKMAQAIGTRTNCTEIHFYTDEMKDSLMRGEYLKSELPGAISRGELLVYLQPKFDVKTEHITGAEALVRWNYRGQGIMSPDKFVPCFEKNNAISIVDEYVIRKVCETLADWKVRGLPLYPISVNLSRVELLKDTLVPDLIDIVDEHHVDHSLIEFELTESAAYEDRDYLLKVMHQLRDAGFGLSMDDFGTGYSSFNLLKDMPLSTLKIDKSFVDDVGTEGPENKSELIVNDIIHMVKHLSITCVAEGVESENQKNVLAKMGCDYIQGYYYSRPIPIREYEKYLEE